MRNLLFLALAGPALAADIGSPVPRPTGDNTADVARIVSYLERSEARSADLATRLDALEARLAALERPRTSAPPPHLPPSTYPVYLPPSPPQDVVILPPRGVAARPFRAPVHYDPDHRCDRCGASQYVQAGPGPVPNSHLHVCARCGNVWYHENK